MSQSYEYTPEVFHFFLHLALPETQQTAHLVYSLTPACTGDSFAMHLCPDLPDDNSIGLSMIATITAGFTLGGLHILLRVAMITENVTFPYAYVHRGQNLGMLTNSGLQYKNAQTSRTSPEANWCSFGRV
ncbi:unnamed protein product [Protopolystoma xenopodis]|uniref:Uncharacterized protein n=1 Tax=Protopolystoma xenopodis TaxID=117903 RepID=A0A3S5FBS4_9PLAT|nr:unnamed protein product [Protopolystoma xenopodis]